MNPTQAEIESIFGTLSNLPSGYVAFFDHVDDDVKWEITGQNSLSGIWLSKSVFMKEVWLPIIKLIADPGPVLEIVSAETIMKTDDGWIAIELKTTNTRTKLGNRLYNQHYCWKCKFNAAKKIVQVRAFIDSSTAEAILSEEKFRQEALDIVPNSGCDLQIETPSYPSIPFNPALKIFLNLFYLLTDQPKENQRYVECFTPNALVLVGARVIKGREGILTLRNSMWNSIKERTHRPQRVYPYGPNSNTAMIYGIVEYLFKDGSRRKVDWAARCDFVKHDRVYLDRYQVYLSDDVAWNSRSDPTIDS